MWRGQEDCRSGAGGNVFVRKLTNRGISPAAKSREKLRKTLGALRVANVKHHGLGGRMAQQQLRQLQTAVAGDTKDGDLAGISHFTRASRFSFCRDSRDFLSGGDDQHGVVAGNGAGNFGKLGAIDGGGERLGAAGRRFQYEHVHGGANIAQKLRERARQLRQRSRVFGQNCGGTVAALRFYQAQFLNVPGKRGLGDAQFFRSKPPAQVFLAGDVGITYETENLAMAKCFGCTHIKPLYIHLYFYTFSRNCQ